MDFADHLVNALAKMSAVEILGIPADTVILLNPRYKKEDGKEVLDPEETAKASLVVYNIGGVK